MRKRAGMLPHWHENVIYPDLISTNVHAYIQMVATYRYIYLIQNSQAVKKECGPEKGYGEKRCEIQGGGQEMAVMVG